VSQARLCLPLLALLLGGCGTLPSGRGWGEDATWRPGWERVRSSAVNAARDPWVWAPLAGAAVLQIDDLDRRTADWAREHTPVFGSQRNAENWSDDLRTASVVAHYATVLATPSGDDFGEWLANKARGTLVDVAAVSATVAVTRSLKKTVGRTRPNGADDESFPSGHTSSSAVHTRLASRNLRSIDMRAGVRKSLDIGLYALTIGTSWSRIEAGWHFPSDTLVSMALGNFMASFVNDAFLGLDAGSASLTVAATPDGAILQWRTRWR
jgi:membrane-associated phospholipid phosphatase